MLCLTLCIFLVTIVHGRDVSSSPRLCAVTNNPNFSANSDYLYPFEVFYKNRISNGVPKDPFVPCRIRKSNGYTNHTCPVQLLGCPLIEENIHMGLTGNLAWKKTTSMCKLKTNLQDPTNTVQMLVFGGSITQGEHGCGCNRLQPEVFKRCAWVHYLGPWLESIGKAKIKVHNFGKAGTTSEYSAERISGYLSGNGVKKLTASDIILIDHSFNDATLCSPLRIKSLENGLELLIRRLLLVSNSTELPTIIVLDNFIGTNNCQGKVYSTLAQHYGIRFYSYTDAISSNISRTRQADFHYNITRAIEGTPHPPWYTYLFYADFISTVMTYEMDNCNTLFVEDGVKPFVMPAPLMKSEVNNSAVCKPELQPLLRMSHHKVQSGKAIGQYRVPIPNTWQLRLDRKGRGGFISELSPASNLTLVQSAPIVFTLNATIGEVLELNKQSDVVIQVTYLRSYANSGVVTLNVCGKDFYRLDLDALWPDYNEYRYTLPAIRNFRLADGNCDKPGNLSAKMEIILKHNLVVPEGTTLNSLDVSKFIQTMPRQAQLFKIVSIVVCRS